MRKICRFLNSAGERSSPLLAWVLTLALAFTSSLAAFVPVTVRAAGATKASFWGYDQLTEGDWEGRYGSDGYILFGYAAAPTGAEQTLVPDDSLNVSQKPSYLTGMQVTSGASLYVPAGNANSWDADTQVLSKPASYTGNKVKAGLAADNPSSNDLVTIKFQLSDTAPHIVTLYVMNDVRNGWYGVDDDQGNPIILPAVMRNQHGDTMMYGDDWFDRPAEFPGSEWYGYISFLVEGGSFNLTYRSNNRKDNRIAGVFFDTYTGSTAAFESFDADTKGAWNGIYGKDGYVLLGYDNTPDPTSSKQATNYSDVSKIPSYVIPVNGAAYFLSTPRSQVVVKDAATVASTGGDVLDIPADQSGTITGKVYAGVGKGDSAFGSTVPNGSGGYVDGGKRTFTFLLNDNDLHYFTVYATTNARDRWFGIDDLMGNALAPMTQGSNLPGGGQIVLYTSPFP
ncbi:MAG: hypothetical protein LBS62_01970 [Clostridiales bacterium]|jgi:hypothetical protein|nr:hypothetical protein [Clostridiales bacterium]